jgi:hypothetical protein
LTCIDLDRHLAISALFNFNMSTAIEKGDPIMPAISPSNSSHDHSLEMDDAKSRSHASSIAAADEEKSIPDMPIPLARQSTELGPAVKVPRSKRRGLFGQMTLVAEVEDPKTYPRRMKWFITFIVAVAGATAPMGSSIFFRK